MALSIGTFTVVVNSDGTATYGGSGLAYDLGTGRFEPIRVMYLATGIALAALLTPMRAAAVYYAAQALADATAIVNQIQTYAVVPAAGISDGLLAACTGSARVT